MDTIFKYNCVGVNFERVFAQLLQCNDWNMVVASRKIVYSKILTILACAYHAH